MPETPVADRRMLVTVALIVVAIFFMTVKP